MDNKKKGNSMTGKRKNKEKDGPATSLFMQEEELPDFPRGGTSLSKLESQKAGEEVNAQLEAANEHQRTKKEKRSKRRKRLDADKDEITTGISGKLPDFVHSLTAKSLSVGTKMWGIISEVNEKDLVVSLAGGFYGIVTLEEAFDAFTEMSTRNKGGKEFSKAVNLTLAEVFSVGQLVAGVICKLESNATGESLKETTKIWLSLRLSLLYKGLTLDAVQDGMVMTGYIRSIEDHGFVLSFGLPLFSGFLPHRNEADSGCFKWKKGQRVQGVVTSINQDTGVISMQSDPKLIANAIVNSHRGLSVDLLVPGMMVNTRVQAILRNGLLLSFLTYFTGTVDIFNLPDMFPGSNWQEKFSENGRLKARILYVNPVSKAIGLTLNPHLIHNQHPPVRVQVGDIYEDAKIVRIDKGVGLLVELPSKPVVTPGYVHIHDVSDEHIDNLQSRFQKGGMVSARITGCRFIEGMASVTLKASVLTQSRFNYSDLKPGMRVRAKVLRLEQDGAIVQLPNGLKALCPLTHMSEHQISKPRKKFQVGAELDFRILGCKGKMITVTHKKTMVASKLKVLANYEDAVEGLTTHGWIFQIKHNGCYVKFYNKVKGFTHRSELGLVRGQDIKSAFHVGQVVKCTILGSNYKSREIHLSFVSSSIRPLGIKVGDVVSGVVDKISSSILSVDVELGGISAWGTIAFEHLVDNPGHLEQLKTSMKPGYKFDRLLVIDLFANKLVLSAKFSLLESSRSFPLDRAVLEPQLVVQGYISNIIESGIFVKFYGNLMGFVPRHKGLDKSNNDLDSFYIGQSVRAQILNVEKETGKITLSMKQSDCFSTDASLIQGYFLEEEMIANLQATNSCGLDVSWARNFVIGSCLVGEVQQVKDYGVIVNIRENPDIVGLVRNAQLGEATVEVGQEVKARILDIVKVDGLIELSLKPELVRQGQKKGSSSKKKRKLEKSVNLKLHQNVVAVVELLKNDYMVLSLPEHDGSIGFASIRDYNVWLDPHKHFQVGQRLHATVAMPPDAATCGRLLLLLSQFSDFSGVSNSKRARLGGHLMDGPKYQVGLVIEVEIVEIGTLEMRVKLGRDAFGRIHITEVVDKYKGGNPFSPFKVGQKVMAKIVARPKSTGSRKIKLWDLSIRPAVLTGEENNMHEPAFCTGDTLTAFVEFVKGEWIWVAVSSQIRGRIFVLDSSCQPYLLDSFRKRFTPGQAVFCHVLNKDNTYNFLNLTLRGLPSYHKIDSTFLETTEDNYSMDKRQDRKSAVHIHEGDIIGGRVFKILPGVGGLSVQVGADKFGRVHFTELKENLPENPLEGFSEGKFVKCKVLKIFSAPNGKQHFDLSVRRAMENNGELGNDMDAEGQKSASSCLVNAIEDLSPGMEVKGYVKAISEKGCFVMLSPHIDARAVKCNLFDGRLTVGKRVEGRIVNVNLTFGHVDMEIITEDSDRVQETSKSSDRLCVGDIVAGTIQSVKEFGVFIAIEKSDLVGLCHISELSDDFITNISDKYSIGDRVKAKVLKIEEDKKCISLGMKTSYFLSSNKAERDKNVFHEGDIVDGKISKILPGIKGIKVLVGKSKYGRVPFTELRDDFPENPLQGFKEGSTIRCRVLRLTFAPNGKEIIELSLRGLREGCLDKILKGKKNLSAVQSSAYKIENLVPGMEVKGYVKGFSGKLMFVMLSSSVDAAVHFNHLPDSYASEEDAMKFYPPGKLVTGRVLKVEPESQRVRLTLKAVLPDFHVGDIVFGTVKCIEEHGLHINVDNSNVVGFCTIENLSDYWISNIQQEYSVGQNVKAKVLQVGKKMKDGLLLGMKESLFEDELSEHDISEEEHQHIENLDMEAEDGHSDSHSDDHEDSDNDEIDDPANEIFKNWDAAIANTLNAPICPLDVNFDVESNPSASTLNDAKEIPSIELSRAQNESDTKLSKRAKKRQKEQREQEISAAEKRRLDGERPPESIDEYEQLVRASPNSSFVWIKYMAYLLSLAKVDKARDVAERALQTINFREEEEKFNVWVAYLNLENAYGNPANEAVLKVFQRALQYCDPKKLHLALLGMYERTGQEDLAEQLIKAMTKRFKVSAKVWLRYLQNIMKQGKENIQPVLNRALLSLPRHKHIKFISRAAVLEFKIGSPERGRTLLEGVLRNYPKRTDLWSVYLDQEIRKGDAAVVRALFERVTCLDLPPKKMKFLFKKYLDYEKSQGDEMRIEYVKKKAMEYVESKAG